LDSISARATACKPDADNGVSHPQHPLKRAGLLEAMPERRRNDSGMSASVLRASPSAFVR